MTQPTCLTIKPIAHSCAKEEDLFLEWFLQIPSVTEVKKQNETIEIFFDKEEIPKNDQHGLAAIFYRFKMDIEQLNLLLKSHGTGWLFYQNGNPTHHNVWPGGDKKPAFIKNAVICEKIDFFSQLDEKLLFIWLDSIKSIIEHEGIREKHYLHIKKENLTDEDFQELLRLFELYKIDTKQLRALKN